MLADPLNRRILIAEADPIGRAKLLKLLGGLGYSVECCAEGAEVLDRLLAPAPPFVALIDSDMAGLDCPEICRQIGRQRPDFPTWIIAMDEPEDRRPSAGRKGRNTAILESGICDLLAKPVAELELRLRLKTAERVQTMKEELEHSIEATGFQASHDPLTGLWNREALLPLLAQETERVRRTASPMSVILMDLDHFGHRNLEFGYSACDAVLQQVAVRLRRHLRSYDILGRSGEDEFLVALPGCEFEDALAMAERFRSSLMHSPFRTRQISLNLSASFGVTQSGGRSPLIVLREAELALAAAKEAGRDRIRFLRLNQSLDEVLPNLVEELPAHLDPPPFPASNLAGAAQRGTLSVMPLSTGKSHSR